MGFRLLCVVILGVFLTACSKYSEQVKSEYDGHHYSKLYKTLHDAKKDKGNDELLWNMQSGFLSFSYMGPYFSFDDLDVAEKKFSENQDAGLLSSTGSNVAAVLSNDLAIPYRGYVFEGALLNLYKALSLSSVGNYDGARIEFNKANDRQRMAKDYYAKEIKKAHDKAVEEASKEDKEGKSELYEQNTGDDKINSILNEKYSNLKNYAIYENLINPSIPYISGVYFMIEGDYTKAQDLLKEAYGISKAQIVADDMQLLDSRKGSKEYQKYTWVIIEDGDLARKSGLEISIPLILPSGANAVNFALPSLEEGKKNFSSYTANDSKADLIGNTSALFASEFQKHLPSIITRAIISTIVKSVATESMNQFGGTYGQVAGLATSLAFSAINSADTRSSIVLGNTVSVVKVPNNQAQIQISGDGATLLTLSIDDTCQSLLNRKKGHEELSKLVSEKPEDFSARISLFEKYDHGNSVCVNTDNIVYVRVRDNKTTHFIVKGE